MKLLLISPKNRTVYNFRGDLIHKFRQCGYKVHVTGPDNTDLDKVLALGVKFHEIPLKKNGTGIESDLRYAKKLYDLMRREKFDLVLGYTIKPVVYGSLAAKFAKVPGINGLITGGGYTFTAKSFKAKVLGVIVRTLYRLSLRGCTHVIFQNGDDRDEFIQRHLVCAGKCAVVNGSGVNLTRFTPTAVPETPAFFMLSRLLKSKGVVEYLEAAAKVHEKYPDAKFALLGKYETAMQDAVPQGYVEKFIQDGVITRYEETSDVRPYYQACSVFVLPSYREGTPRTVLEAMASGRAIITTDAPGCRETVRDGENGFLVPVGSVDALAEKMEYMIEHPERIREMGEASLKLCRAKFDVDLVNRDMCKILGIAERNA